MAANIRVFCETTKFLEEFLILALISHRFGFTSHWSVGPVDKSPFGRRFSIHGFAQILSLQQRFSLSFAAIDISLHANYALILLNTNCTNYTNMLLSLERFERFKRFVFKNQHSILFLSRSRISRISRIFFVASNDSYITKTASLLYYCIWCTTINLD